MIGEGQGAGRDGGYAMAALLVGLAVMAVLMSAAVPAWRTLAQREREEELVFRGEQYARAVMLFQRKYGGSLPPKLDVLLEQRFLRKKYRDPMTADGEFQLVYQVSAAGPLGPGTAGTATRPGVRPTPTAPSQPAPEEGRRTGPGTGLRGGVMGVVSRSKGQALRTYQGRSRYNEWQFLYSTLKANRPPGPEPGAVPGVSSRPGFPPGGSARPGVSPLTPTRPRD